MNVGARVRFKDHGPTGIICTVVTRDGNDVTLQDPHGRLLQRTPIELLESIHGVEARPEEHLIPNQATAGSNPAGPAVPFRSGSLSPKDCDTASHSPGLLGATKCWREVDELEMR